MRKQTGQKMEASASEVDLPHPIDGLDFGQSPELLGKGKYSRNNVWKAKWKSPRKLELICFGVDSSAVPTIEYQECAVKQIQKNAHDIELISRELHNEIKTLRSLEHKNIVKYYENFKDNLVISIIMEVVPGGSMQDFMTSHPKNKLCASDTVRWCLDIAKAIKFLHQNQIIHRDLRPENILIAFDEPEQRVQYLKISNFGSSRIFNRDDICSVVVYNYYAAPELLQCEGDAKPKIQQQDAPMIDIYSLAVLMNELATFRQPYDDFEMKGSAPRQRGFVLGKAEANNLRKQIVKSFRPTEAIKIDKWVPRAFQKLVAKCWDNNPRKRQPIEKVITSLDTILDEVERDYD